MTKRLQIGGLVLLSATILSHAANPVYEGQAKQAKRLLPANRARVAKAMADARIPKGSVVWYAVPAMSDRMRLHYTYPSDGRLNGALRIVAAQGEFEPASFQLYSFTDRKNVTLTASALKGPNGATMPASALDIKVVKLWFQNGNGWISYFADVGMKLIPEMLLHDEKMVRVDLDEPANYARLKDADGERFVWLSPPRELAQGDTFDPVREPFADSKTLQPVALNAGEFKQFFATLHAPKGQTPGVYTGTIVVAEDDKELCTIPIQVRVLPFELPNARTSFDLDREMIISIMCGQVSLSRLPGLHGCDKETAKRLYDDYLVNLREHGMTHPPSVDQTEESLRIIQKHGFVTKPLMEAKSFAPWYGHHSGGRLTFDNMMALKAAAKKCADYYQTILGHTDLMCGHGDEQGARFIVTYRNFFKYYHDYGIRIGCAGHDSLLYKGGYTYGYYPMGGAPDTVSRIRPWNDIGDKYVGFYATQHTGSENPEYIRRQNGLLGYFSGLSMLYNYEFNLLGWNDMRSSLYKPMVVALYNRGGVVDTLQWEGYREAVDDMRYATYLKLLAKEAVESGDTERRLTAQKALQYLALLDPATMDLNVVRAEIIEHILKLRALQ